MKLLIFLAAAVILWKTALTVGESIALTYQVPGEPIKMIALAFFIAIAIIGQKYFLYREINARLQQH